MNVSNSRLSEDYKVDMKYSFSFFPNDSIDESIQWSSSDIYQWNLRSDSEINTHFANSCQAK